MLHELQRADPNFSKNCLWHTALLYKVCINFPDFSSAVGYYAVLLKVVLLGWIITREISYLAGSSIPGYFESGISVFSGTYSLFRKIGSSSLIFAFFG